MKLHQRKPLYLKDESLVEFYEKTLNAKYMGIFYIRSPEDPSKNLPAEIFYTTKPAEGMSSYIGVVTSDGNTYAIDAKSCFNEPMIGVCENDVVYVSRYPGDDVTTPTGTIIKGGPFEATIVCDITPERRSDITKNIMSVNKVLNILVAAGQKKELRQSLRAWLKELHAELSPDSKPDSVNVVSVKVTKSRFYFKSLKSAEMEVTAEVPEPPAQEIEELAPVIPISEKVAKKPAPKKTPTKKAAAAVEEVPAKKATGKKKRNSKKSKHAPTPKKSPDVMSMIEKALNTDLTGKYDDF